MPGPISGALGGWLSGDPTQQKSTGTTDSLDEMLKKLAELAKKRQATPGVAPGAAGSGVLAAQPSWMDQIQQLIGGFGATGGA